MTYGDLEVEAWRIGRSGNRAAIINFCSQSIVHRMLMSGEIRLKGKPKGGADDRP